MKTSTLPLLLAIASTSLILSCGGPPPIEELDAAMQALDGARNAGAEKFASGQLGAAQSAYDEAKTAMEAEDQKLFKNFDEVKLMISDASAKAQEAQSAATAAKEAARQEAEAAIDAAKAAVQRAWDSLEAAPAGKGTEGDIEQLRADLGAADADLNAASAAVSEENFEMATSNAQGAEETAATVEAGVQAAVERYHELVEKMRPWYEKF